MVSIPPSHSIRAFHTQSTHTQNRVHGAHFFLCHLISLFLPLSLSLSLYLFLSLSLPVISSLSPSRSLFLSYSFSASTGAGAREEADCAAEEGPVGRGEEEAGEDQDPGKVSERAGECACTHTCFMLTAVI